MEDNYIESLTTPVTKNTLTAQSALPDENLKAKMSTSDLSVFYGNSPALRNVSLNIFSNEVTALIGPSGCGKSTFIRSLNRMNDT